MNLILLKNQS